MWIRKLSRLGFSPPPNLKIGASQNRREKPAKAGFKNKKPSEEGFRMLNDYSPTVLRPML